MAERLVHRLLVLVSVLIIVAVSLPVIPLSAAFVPARMAVLGDSITRGFNACGWFLDCESLSWAGGTDAGIRSHYLRLKAKNGSLTAYNDAVTRARVAALDAQARMAVTQHADYVTILIGANDACTTSEQTMTSVADFEARFRAAMSTLRQGLPNALIFVSSIPDIRRLWEVGKDNALVRLSWTLSGVCRSMMFHPWSTAAPDMARRARVRGRVIAFNRVLARVCAEQPTCRFDGNAVFSYPFRLSEVSRWDYFHPNDRGQAALARLTYRSGFWSRAARRHIHWW